MTYLVLDLFFFRRFKLVGINQGCDCKYSQHFSWMEGRVLIRREIVRKGISWISDLFIGMPGTSNLQGPGTARVQTLRDPLLPICPGTPSKTQFPPTFSLLFGTFYWWVDFSKVLGNGLMWYVLLQLWWLSFVLSLPPSPSQLNKGFQWLTPLIGRFQVQKWVSRNSYDIEISFLVLATLFCLGRRMAADFLWGVHLSIKS